MTNLDSKNLIYEGKAKRLYSVEAKDEVLVEFKDSLTAFNAAKKGSFEGKGVLNLEISNLIFSNLEKKGIKTHFVKAESKNTIRVKKVKIIPLEVVVRNTLAGSTAKKFGIAEGKVLKSPLVEFYLKDDALGDPFVSDDQVEMLEICHKNDLLNLKSQALEINQHLKSLMLSAKLNLVDFKVEFGWLEVDQNGQNLFQKKLLLADEISPDCCRLWDIETGEKMDKDRFRRDLGHVEESYREVYRRLKEVLK